MQQTLSEHLAAWVSRTGWGEIPQAVKDASRLQILDATGAMLAARPSDIVAGVERAVAETDPGVDARPLGFASTFSLAGAAFINGVMSAVLEYDDTHIETFVHPTASPFSVALPFCQRRALSGPRLMEAVIMGSELSCRLGLVAPVRLHSLGIHPTAIMGAFGAVYALSRLAGLDERQIVCAIGHSASMCGGLMASWEDGSSTKMLHVGMGASQAVRAVALAKQGVSGPASAFDGRFGWFRTHVQDTAVSDFRFSRATQDLGEQWELLEVASKPYPSAFTLHPYVDAVLALREQHKIDASDVAEIRCRIAKSSIATMCEPVAEKLRPLTSWHGRISLQHSLAEAFVMGRLDKTAYSPTALKDPRINTLADKVSYEVDPARQHGDKKAGAHVMIRTVDGARFEHVIDSVRGTRDNPITVADYCSKFRSNAQGVIDAGQIDKTIDALLDLEHCDNVAPVFDAVQSWSERPT